MNTPATKQPCPNCHQIVFTSQMACEFCGHRLPWAQTPQPSATPPEKAFDINEFVGLKGQPDRSYKGTGAGALAGMLAVALPYAFVAVTNVLSSKSAFEQREAWIKVVVFAVLGLIIGFFAALATGKRATVIVIAPVLLVLSYYFMLNYN